MAINFDGKGNIEATTPDGVIAVKLYSLEKTLEEKDKEIERLNNIINEFDNWLDLALEVFNNVDVKTLELVKRKLQELKGSDK